MNSQDRVVAQSVERVEPVVPILRRDIINVVLVGLGTGLAINLLYYLLQKFVFGAVMCRDISVNDCSDAPKYAMIVSMVIGSLGGLIALVQIRIYRPLLAVLAVAVSLWGFNVLLAGIDTWLGIALLSLLFGAAYLLFVWIARIRSFILAVITSIVVMVIIRLVLVG